MKVFLILYFSRKETISNSSLAKAAKTMAEVYNSKIDARQKEIDKHNLEIAMKLSNKEISRAEATRDYIPPLKKAKMKLNDKNEWQWASRFKRTSNVGGGGKGLKVNTPGNYLSHDDPLCGS